VNEWAILSLRETSDAVTVAEVEADLRMRWAPVVCKFPAVKQLALDRENPLSNYVFVQVPLSPKLEKSPYATKFLRDPLTRRLQKVTDAELAVMVSTTPLPEPGTTIKVTAGDFCGLDATVVETNCSSVKCLVELWSKQSILTLSPNEFSCV
jgi:hypothetical protein